MLVAEIIGNIGVDAIKKDINGKPYVSFSVAHSERKNESEETVWLSVLMPGDGGRLFEYLKKGTKVFVRGRLSSSIYSDKSGTPHVSLSLFSSEIQLCGSANTVSTSTSTDSDPDLPF